MRKDTTIKEHVNSILGQWHRETVHKGHNKHYIKTQDRGMVGPFMSNIGMIGEDLYCVMTPTSNSMWALYNSREGRYVTDFVYCHITSVFNVTDIDDIRHGIMFPASRDGKDVFIDHLGNELDFGFRSIVWGMEQSESGSGVDNRHLYTDYPHWEGVYVVRTTDGKVGLFDTCTGEHIMGGEDAIFLCDGIALIKNGGSVRLCHIDANTRSIEELALTMNGRHDHPLLSLSRLSIFLEPCGININDMRFHFGGETPNGVYTKIPISFDLPSKTATAEIPENGLLCYSADGRICVAHIDINTMYVNMVIPQYIIDDMTQTYHRMYGMEMGKDHISITIAHV